MDLIVSNYSFHDRTSILLSEFSNIVLDCRATSRPGFGAIGMALSFNSDQYGRTWIYEWGGTDGNFLSILDMAIPTQQRIYTDVLIHP